MKPIHNGFKSRFDMMLHLQLFIPSVGGDVPIDNKVFKIKPAQSFRDAYRGRVYAYIFIR